MNEQNRDPDPVAVELKRISVIGILAFLLFGLSVLLDGPVTMLSWLLTIAGFLCLVYLIIASRYLLKRRHSHSPKVDS
jgi:Ca2+/Na+ antiporter